MGLSEEHRTRDTRHRSNSASKRPNPNRKRLGSLLRPSLPSFKRYMPPLPGSISKLRPRMPSRIPLRKPPQLIRWDIIIMFLCEIWGYINSCQLPVFIRVPLYRLWGFIFRCDLDESKYPIAEYKCLQDFFTRPLKDGVRPISEEILASPVDGKVMAVGVVKNQIEQVKGHSYTLTHFLGANNTLPNPADPVVEGNQKRTKLFHMVVYLAPGDYHRIHSPVEWKIARRRHFPGTLLPVAPLVGKVVPQLLALNERVVLSGEWDHGFFSLTAVGAYNVGSIKMHFDDVRTNNIYRDWTCNNLQYFSWKGLGTHFYERNFGTQVDAEKGQELGLFRLGSTVVLIFEAPEDFEFTVGANEKIKMGQTLGRVPSSSSEDQQ